ncbi:MAG: DegV family protein [Actinomycetota bacterium]|jgi:DegV family protein with EDD domain|nr:DegV family protein [Actinomycetota bacterium]
MARTLIVTDSAADLDPEVAERNDIKVVELDVRLGEIGPEVTRTWSPEQFWHECANKSVLPETSAPSPGAFVSAYLEGLADGHDGVVCITLSSKLSATYQAAAAGAAEVQDRIPVQVVDSQSVTMGEGILALSAAESARAGLGVSEIAAAAEEGAHDVRVYGSLDTLENLRKGGRIGNAQAIFGSLLAIKPVIEVRGGLIEAESRQRTRIRSLKYLAEKVKAAGALEQLAVVHGAAEDVDSLVDMLSGCFPREAIQLGHIGPVIGTHAGAGSIAVCFKVKRQ